MLRSLLLAGIAAAAYVHGWKDDMDAPWGAQTLVLNQRGKALQAKQLGTGAGRMQASARDKGNINLAAGRKVYKAGIEGKGKSVFANGPRGEPSVNAAELPGSNNYFAERAGGKARIITQGRVGAVADVVNPKTKSKSEVRSKVSGNKVNTMIRGGDKYEVEFKGEQFTVKENAGKKTVAKGKLKKSRGTGGAPRNQIPIEFFRDGKVMNNIVAESMKERGGYTADAKIVDKKTGKNKEYYSETKGGSRTLTKIGQKGGFLTAKDAQLETDKLSRKITMRGKLLGLKFPSLTLRDRGQNDRPCRPKAGESFPWNNGRYKIDTQKVKVTTTQPGGKGSLMKLKWPDCIDVKIPMRFPAGTKIENLAVAMKLVMPACNQLLCDGYVCGSMTAAKMGMAEETCWMPDLCNYTPTDPSRNSVIRSALSNSTNNACKTGYTGEVIMVVARFCPMKENARMGSSCAPANLMELFKSGGGSSQIQAIVTVYQKKRGKSGLGSFISKGITKVLTQCNKSDYQAMGCHELTQDYQMTAFGMDEGTYSFKKTGINRSPSGNAGATLAPMMPTRTDRWKWWQDTT